MGLSLHDRELVVARLLAGVVPLHLQLGNKTRRYLLKTPTRLQRLEAQEVYLEALEEGLEQKLFSEDELLDHLLANGQWDKQRQVRHDSLPKEIEDLKVRLFQAVFRAKEREALRRTLARFRAELSGLHSERHTLDHLSAAGHAAQARTRYLVGCSLCRSDGSLVFSGDEFYRSRSSILEDAVREFTLSQLGENQVRELARTDPWRTVWSSRKVENGLFGVPAADLSDEQRAIVGWSQLYDSVREHPDCPYEDVLADDDLLDGWLILQRRQREGERVKRESEGLIKNEKIANSQEIYLVADTVEDARRIESLNDAGAASMKRKRLSLLAKKGEVDEMDMPDTKQRFRMAVNEAVSSHIKGAK